MWQFPVPRVVTVRAVVMVTLFVTCLRPVNMSAGSGRYDSAAVDSSSWYPAAGDAETQDDVVELSDESMTDGRRSVETNQASDAFGELTRLFGISHLPVAETDSPTAAVRPGHRLRHQHARWGRHRAPPEYMVELYNAVAYTDGISKTANPYEADIVRGISDKAATDQVYYYFNVSHINQTEEVLEAELHLFKLRPGSMTSEQQGRPRARSQASHIVDVRIFEILSEEARDSLAANHRLPLTDQTRLVVQRRVSAHRHGWEVFKIRDVVRRWVDDPSTNHGFLVTSTTLSGEPVNGTLVRFAQRSEHHDSKQPVLVVFSDEDQLDTSPENIENDDFQPPIVTDSNLKTMRKNYVNFLNEAYRAQHGTGPLAPGTKTRTRRPNTYYMNPVVHQRLVNGSTTSSSRQRRSSDSGMTGNHNGVSRPGYHPGPSRRRKRTCQRHEMYVDFEKIGWSGWIISPKGYNAYQCRGVCPFPLGQNQHPSNHATVQSIIHALRIGPGTTGGGHGGGGTSQTGGVSGVGVDGLGVDTPCCVPNKLYSISLLYFDDDENVILKQYDEMVAASCGCH